MPTRGRHVTTSKWAVNLTYSCEPERNRYSAVDGDRIRREVDENAALRRRFSSSASAGRLPGPTLSPRRLSPLLDRFSTAGLLPGLKPIGQCGGDPKVRVALGIYRSYGHTPDLQFDMHFRRVGEALHAKLVWRFTARGSANGIHRKFHSRNGIFVACVIAKLKSDGRHRFWCSPKSVASLHRHV
jgi:hypothetical protein